MRALFVLLSVLSIAALGATPASAKIMRFTQQGETALVFHMPDNWTSNIDMETGSETLIPPDRFGDVSLTIMASDASLEAVAAEVIKDAEGARVDPPSAVTVSGKRALYFTEPNVGGGKLNMKLLVIQVDEHHIAICMALTQLQATPDQVAAAESILNSIRVSPPDMSFGS